MCLRVCVCALTLSSMESSLCLGLCLYLCLCMCVWLTAFVRMCMCSKVRALYVKVHGSPCIRSVCACVVA